MNTLRILGIAGIAFAAMHTPELSAETPARGGPQYLKVVLDSDRSSKSSEIAGLAHTREAAHPGEKIYKERCASCHDNPQDTRTPGLSNMRAMNPARVLFSLTQGKMKLQAEGLNPMQIGQLVDYLSDGKESGGFALNDTDRCQSKDITLTPAFVTRWGVDAGNTRYYGPDKTKITRKTVGKLKLAWAFGLPSTAEARSQPVITQDTIFIAATSGHLFALDRVSGCVKWHKDLQTWLRTPLTLGAIDDEPVLFFSDAVANVHAVRALDGSIIWKKNIALFPQTMTTAGISQHNDMLFVPLSSFDVAAAANPKHECCKSHGAVVALKVATGDKVWTSRMTEPAKPTIKSSVGVQQWGPSGAPVWTTPAVDAKNGRIYIGTGENTSAPATETSDAMIALDMKTGERLWVYQATKGDTYNMACRFGAPGPNCPKPTGPDYDFGGAVVYTTLSDGREVVVGGQKSGVVHMVDAATGTLIWNEKVSAGSALGGVHWGVSVAGDRVFVPSSDPPFPIPFYMPKPGLYTLDLLKGEMQWSHAVKRNCKAKMPFGRDDLEPWPDCSFYFGYSAAPSSTDELVFIGALDGQVHAFNAETGDILWTADTKREFNTVNSISAHGGAIDNAGVQLADDMLFVQSGYALFGQMPGNAFLAFKIAD